MTTTAHTLLDQVDSPDDLKKLAVDELPTLSDEVRAEIIRVCSRGGLHLASSLGTVELTVALHYVFNSPKDRILWDVGHQAYGHKILTGRKSLMDTIKKEGGLSGFTKVSESEHDAITVGHASTSLANAFGMALARDAMGEDYHVIPVIGDGALTGGMALAALNNIGYKQSKMLIVLNDNEMSISENVGALNNYFRTLQVQKWFQSAEASGKKLVGRFSKPGPSSIRTARTRSRRSTCVTSDRWMVTTSRNSCTSWSASKSWRDQPCCTS
jgi:1-deoxy-D-xylulose-5-phosphate synthase